jgi:hypothetical protein
VIGIDYTNLSFADKEAKIFSCQNSKGVKVTWNLKNDRPMDDDQSKKI